MNTSLKEKGTLAAMVAIIAAGGAYGVTEYIKPPVKELSAIEREHVQDYACGYIHAMRDSAANIRTAIGIMPADEADDTPWCKRVKEMAERFDHKNIDPR